MPTAAPPPLPSSSNPPPPPPPPQPPAAGRAKRVLSNVELALAGLGLVLAIAAVVAGRVKFNSFALGIALVVALGVVAAVFAIRSHQTTARRAVLVATIVLVVGAAIPASTKAVFPVYDHFFGHRLGEASQAQTASPRPEAPTPANSPAAGPTASAPSASPSASGSKSKTVVDGKDITSDGQSDPSCDAEMTGAGTNEYHISFPNGWIFLNSSMTGLTGINLGHNGTWSFGWPNGDPGGSQVTKSGNDLKISGRVQPTDPSGRTATGSPVPFEVDLTCP